MNITGENNRITNRHIARILSGIGELSVAQESFLKSNIRWLVKDLIIENKWSFENENQQEENRTE